MASSGMGGPGIDSSGMGGPGVASSGMGGPGVASSGMGGPGVASSGMGGPGVDRSRVDAAESVFNRDGVAIVDKHTGAFVPVPKGRSWPPENVPGETHCPICGSDRCKQKYSGQSRKTINSNGLITIWMSVSWRKQMCGMNALVACFLAIIRTLDEPSRVRFATRLPAR